MIIKDKYDGCDKRIAKYLKRGKVIGGYYKGNRRKYKCWVVDYIPFADCLYVIVDENGVISISRHAGYDLTF